MPVPFAPRFWRERSAPPLRPHEPPESRQLTPSLERRRSATPQVGGYIHLVWLLPRGGPGALIMLRCLNGHWGIRSPERRFGTWSGTWLQRHSAFRDLAESVRPDL